MGQVLECPGKVAPAGQDSKRNVLKNILTNVCSRHYPGGAGGFSTVFATRLRQPYPVTSMLLATLLLALSGAGPSLPDTTRTAPGYGGQTYAWGTLMPRRGPVVRAYLPTTDAGFHLTVPYYTSLPAAGRKPKMMAATNVRWIRVAGQYSVLMQPDPGELGELAVQRVAGPVEVFRVKTVPTPVASFMGSAPVLSAPVSGSGVAGTRWYLRRPDGTILRVDPDRFASQVAAFLAADKELAQRVATRQPGYGLAELEAVVRQYNQRAAGR